MQTRSRKAALATPPKANSVLESSKAQSTTSTESLKVEEQISSMKYGFNLPEVC